MFETTVELLYNNDSRNASRNRFKSESAIIVVKFSFVFLSATIISTLLHSIE